MGGRLTFRADDQTLAFDGASIDDFENVDHFLFVLEREVEFVVITGSKVAEHVFVAEKEHDTHWIVEFIHLVESRDLVNVAYINSGKVANLFGNVVQNLVHLHTFGVVISAKPNHNQTVFLRENGLINMPSSP
ncbi:hypothetical protein TRICI_005719 [Trichomonascus ciferrii]|uniref:Uncharacterized protein n=1 Tax=Trichomonascus ciferrii TaxID=44093 RepID=A0A642UPX7_9ASCO|nr:hypothetical protein TRICI_005719 [Trichomonascus ciferrii]